MRHRFYDNKLNEIQSKRNTTFLEFSFLPIFTIITICKLQTNVIINLWKKMKNLNFSKKLINKRFKANMCQM